MSIIDNHVVWTEHLYATNAILLSIFSFIFKSGRLTACVTWRSSVEADSSQVFCLILLHHSFILQRERCGHFLVHLGVLMC